jgi:Domain of unknown function (DUF5348)
MAGQHKKEKEYQAMSEQQIGVLVASTNRGRFALDDPQEGADITSGQALDIWLAGQWIPGRVEHMTECYPGQSMTRLFQPESELGPRTVHGYYFLADKGGICGLCIGQKVRLA